MDPLPGAATAARQLRRIVGLILAHESDDGAMEQTCAELGAIEDRLRASTSSGAPPRIGDAADGRVYVDH